MNSLHVDAVASPAAPRQLHEHRAAGRYADAPFVIDHHQLSALLDIVEAVVEAAVARTGRDA